MTTPKKRSVLAIQETILKEAVLNPAKLMANTQKETHKSTQWFLNRVKRETEREGSGGSRAGATIVPGHMYYYRYNPIGKDTLPYYDIFPLVIPVTYRESGFIGLNLHYLPPAWRARLLMLMVHNFSMSNSETQYLKMTYNQLRSISAMKAFQPCVKMYLYKQMRNKLRRIPPTEWTNAIMLPLQHFVGATDTFVWRNSMERIF